MPISMFLSEADAGLWPIFTGLLLALAVGAAILLERERRLRVGLQLTLQAERAKPPQQVFVQGRAEGERDDQQRRIAELHILKTQAELELLGRQVNSKDLEADRIAASKEYHELMVEKTRLEIDSLRLHILEQRKRAEDWRSDQD